MFSPKLCNIDIKYFQLVVYLLILEKNSIISDNFSLSSSKSSNCNRQNISIFDNIHIIQFGYIITVLILIYLFDLLSLPHKINR